MAKIVNLETGSIQEINSKKFMIGRSIDCDLVLKDIQVSRKHCFIEKVDPNSYVLYNLSSNGTSLNDNRLNEQPVRLNHNDIISIGETKYRIVIESTDTASGIMDGTINLMESFDDFQDAEVIVIEDQYYLDIKESSSKPAPTASGGQPNDSLHDNMKEELTCTICAELYIDVVTLNCTHSFCTLCLDTWKAKSNSCPICRETITSITRVRTMDNLIKMMVSKMSESEQKSREELVKRRKQVPSESSPAVVLVRSVRAGRGRGARGGTRRTRRNL